MSKYEYYDDPEGKNIYKKVIVLSKYAIAFATPMATFDVLLYSKPKGIFNIARRYAFFIGPMVGMATAFTVTSNVLHNIREKNDKYNYFFGGAVAGIVAAAWVQSAVALPPLAIALGTAGVVKKTAIEDNVTFFPNINPQTKTIQSSRFDFTFVKDLNELKTWTTGKE